jgi:hypothetical protein
MAEITNNTLAILVFAALAVVIAGSFTMFGGGGLTGFATSDSGNVTLTINESLNIQVDTGNKVIAFGGCTPRAATSYSCASNDTQVCDGTGLSNCTGDTITPQYIRVENVGNVNASVNVSSSCSAAQLIGGTSPGFQYVTTFCDGTNVSTWTTFSTVVGGEMACPNVAVGGSGFRLFANVTIPNNAQASGCTNGNAVLTFSAITAS